MGLPRTGSAAFLLALFVAHRAVLAQDPEALVVVGAGAAGPWVTEYEFANRDTSTAQVHVGPAPFSVPCPPLQPCEQSSVSLPGRGVAKVPALPYGRTFVGSTFVTVANAALPTVRARIINSSRPAQSIELPVTRLSTIRALNPSELVFPTAVRTGTAHSNLVLSELSLAAPLTVRVEAHSAEGRLLGAANFVLERGNSLFIVDVIGALGIAELASGQVRVTRMEGTGLLWGLLATVTDEGQIFATLGINP